MKSIPDRDAWATAHAILAMQNEHRQLVLEKVSNAPLGERLLDTLQQRGHFRPEFLNRIDDIIIFDRLTDEDLTHIVETQLARLTKRLMQQKLTVNLTDAAKRHLAREGYDPVYGARPLKRAIQRDLLDPLSIQLLEGKFTEGSTIAVDAQDGRLVFASP